MWAPPGAGFPGLVQLGVSPEPVADSRGDRPVAPALVRNASRTGEELMPAGTSGSLHCSGKIIDPKYDLHVHDCPGYLDNAD
jgi:hypothetical protein